MEVNIEAFSAALDSILVAEASSKSKKTHSAIINRESTSLLKLDSNFSESKPTRPVSLGICGASSLNCQSGAADTEVPVADLTVVAEKLSTETQPKPYRQESPRYGNEKAHTVNKSEKERLRKLSQLGDPEKLPTRNSAENDPSTGAVNFLERLERVKVVPFRVVEATGIGIKSVILTPKNVDQVISRYQLPSKSWITNISVASKASALFELQNKAGVQGSNDPLSCLPVSPVGQPEEVSTNSHAMQNLFALVIVEDENEKDSFGPQNPGSRNDERPLFSVTVQTSDSRRGVFTLASSGCATSGRLTALEIPGHLLKSFVQLTISPPTNRPCPKFIRVRAICIFFPESSTKEREVYVRKVHSSRERKTETATLEGGKATSQNVELIEKRAQEQDLIETDLAEMPSIKLTTNGEERKDEQVAHLTSPCHDNRTNVANFVKGIALTQMLQDSTTSKKSIFLGGNTVEYDWLSDTLVNLSTTKRCDNDSAVRNACEPSKELETPTLEFIRALEAWNSAPALTVEAAIRYCLSETTSFSVSTIYATGLFSNNARIHFLQPFKLHFFVVSTFPDNEKGSMQALAFGVRVPPVHLLSAIAGQAASSGYMTELLFTCPVNNGFVCALRPYNCSSGAQGTYHKLLLVVPAHSSDENKESDTSSLTKNLLSTALSIFCEPAEMRGRRLNLDTSFSLHRTFSYPKPCGALRLLIDGTGGFDDLMPVLSEWAKVSGALRYYGSAAQRTVQLLFFPSRLGSHDRSSERLGVVSELRREAQWSCVRLRLTGFWKDTIEIGSALDDIVALDAEYHCPATYVWQSRLGALRLVLTDAHFMEYTSHVDGLLGPSSLVSLIKGYYGKDLNNSASIPPLVNLSEAPLMTLVKAAQRLRQGSAAAAAPLDEGASVDFYALRRRVSVSLAFQILSTGFKRGWGRVSACIPLCYGQLGTDMSESQSAYPPVFGANRSSENSRGSALGLLDEDAFMDTFLQWQYPFPNVVVMHCANVVDVSPMSSPTAFHRAPFSREREGVLFFFSEEVLRSFGSVSTPEEALS